MTGNQLLINPRKGHPKDTKLSDALEEDKARAKAQKGVIRKNATLVSAGVGEEGEIQKVLGGTMTPDSEQLAKINQFTRRSVSEEEVVAFTTLSCNDIEDRDDDQFTTQCVKDFAELEQPFSPTGKSYMLDHNYSVGNAVGRIFDTNVAKVGGATFLTNEVYIPNTDQFAPLIEKIDYGVAWAVSVGVMLDKSECSLSFCDAAFSSWGYWCRNGHDKGLYYTEDAEEDSWGFPKPTDPSTSGAEKCVQQFKEPRDFYELSQVFLGAQYYAALEDKDPALAGAVKSAMKSTNIPIIGASAEEARKLPLRHEPEKVTEARMKHKITEADDGSLVWTDEEGLVYSFDPSDAEAEVFCLGRTNKDPDEGSEEESDDGHEVSDSGGSDDSGESDEGVNDPDDGDDEDSSEAGGSGSSGAEGSSASVDDPDDSEEKSMSKKAVLAAAREAKIPQAIIDKANDSEGNGLDALLLAVAESLENMGKEVTSLSEKASLGDAYLKGLRAEAIDWYVKARTTPEAPKVSTSTFERLLDKCGDDADLLKEMASEQKEIAQARFPKSVRRSSAETKDPNSRVELEEPEFGKESDDRVRKLHG